MVLKSVDDIYRDPPLVHWQGTHTFHIPRQLAQCIFDAVQPDMATLETGCGISTVVFVMSGCRHITVTPRATEVERVKAYLLRHGLDSSRLTAEVGPSQDVLPRIATEPLDFVLIDGQHAFPVPFLDWYYAARSLRVGGTLVIDDTQLWTGRILRQFLSAEPGWGLINDFFGRAAVFRKLTPNVDAQWWGLQPFMVARSRRGQAIERARRRLLAAVGRIDNRHNGKASMSTAARSVTSDDPAVATVSEPSEE